MGLIPHPTTPNAAVHRIDVDLCRAPDSLTLLYRLDGDVGRLRIPPEAPPRFVTALWQHTCFEAFIALDGQSSYHELNFSPSGEWAAFGFPSYRDGAPVDCEPLKPDVVLRSDTSHLEVEVRVALDRLSSAYPDGTLRIGLSAVIEASDGTLSYWALRHPAARPDFHHPEAFTVRLERLREGC